MSNNTLPILHIHSRGGLSSGGGGRNNKHSARNMIKTTPTATATTATVAADAAPHTSIDTAAALPLLSDRPTARDTAGRRQRIGGKSAASTAMSSARSTVSATSEGERSDSEMMSRADYSQSVSSISTKGTTGLFGNNPYAATQGANKSASATKTKPSGEDVEMSLDQVCTDSICSLQYYILTIFIVLIIYRKSQGTGLWVNTSVPYSSYWTVYKLTQTCTVTSLLNTIQYCVTSPLTRMYYICSLH